MLEAKKFLKMKSITYIFKDLTACPGNGHTEKSKLIKQNVVHVIKNILMYKIKLHLLYFLLSIFY